MVIVLFIRGPNRNALNDAYAESFDYTAPIHADHQATDARPGFALQHGSGHGIER
jgi:hypothetical protein